MSKAQIERDFCWYRANGVRARELALNWLFGEIFGGGSKSDGPPAPIAALETWAKPYPQV